MEKGSSRNLLISTSFPFPVKTKKIFVFTQKQNKIYSGELVIKNILIKSSGLKQYFINNKKLRIKIRKTALERLTITKNDT